MSPVFCLQIVYPNGDLVRLPGGGVLEQNLVDHLVSHIQQRRTGLFTTEAQVETAIRDGIVDALMAMKLETVSLAIKQGPPL